MNTGRFRFHLFMRTAGPIVALVISLGPVSAPASQHGPQKWLDFFVFLITSFSIVHDFP
jgi:hypothetical protein